MQVDTTRTRHGLLLVVASASVTMAVAVTVGALTGYLHPPRTVESTSGGGGGHRAIATYRARPDPSRRPAAPAPLDDEMREPRRGSAHSEERHARRERDDDGDRRRHEEHEDDD